MTGLLTIADLSAADLLDILALSETHCGRPLDGRGVAMLFQKPSARTRNSMEMAVVQLGGHPITIAREEVGLGTRETPEDVARTLACYHAVIAARVADHDVLVRMAAATSVPVVNMLSDGHHPLQALADLLTIRQLLGSFDNARIAYVGAANNVTRSLAQGCALLGIDMRVASPAGLGFAQAEADALGLRQTTDPHDAVAGANIVYTDVWVSMGEDAQAPALRAALAPYQVDAALMATANDAHFLHCLPAHRGEEVAAEVIDGPRSAVWRQAANRMHTARGALAWLMGVRA